MTVELVMATAEAERPRNPSRSFTLGQATATEDQPEDVASSFGRTFSMVADSVNPASLMDAFEGDESREDSEAGGGGLGLPDVLSGRFPMKARPD